MQKGDLRQLLSEGRPFLVKEIDNLGEQDIFPLRIDGGGVCLCTSGEADVSINTTKYRLQSDDEAILLDDHALFINGCSADFRLTLFLYTKEVAFQAMHKFEPAFFTNIVQCPLYRHSEESGNVIRSYLSILNSLQYDVRNRFATIMVMNLLRCIMLNIYDKMKRRGDSHAQTLNTRKEDIFHKFIALVHEHGREHRDVAFYADKLCISPRYLGEVTKKIANESPKQCIDYHIVSEIKLLLTFSEMSIQQIAHYLHFPDQSYLGRFFKHHTGVSPAAYRMKELGR